MKYKQQQKLQGPETLNMRDVSAHPYLEKGWCQWTGADNTAAGQR
jgi:hypothetical protein